MRDLTNYASKYCSNNFEEVKVKYRRDMILNIINETNVKKIMEIGCGMEPLFCYTDDPNTLSWTIVEPCDRFYENALKQKTEKVTLIKGFFEDSRIQKIIPNDFDMIICSSLLHEVENPKTMLNAIASKCNRHTTIHINVPNANSMHRHLGKMIGIISEVHKHTKGNIDLQQNTVFDYSLLKQMVLECGMKVIDEGGFFIKPFSHKQRYEMLQTGIIDDKVLDGLNQLGVCMPEYASEIWINCKLA